MLPSCNLSRYVTLGFAREPVVGAITHRGRPLRGRASQPSTCDSGRRCGWPSRCVRADGRCGMGCSRRCSWQGVHRGGVSGTERGPRGAERCRSAARAIDDDNDGRTIRSPEGRPPSCRRRSLCRRGRGKRGERRRRRRCSRIRPTGCRGTFLNTRPADSRRGHHSLRRTLAGEGGRADDHAYLDSSAPGQVLPERWEPCREQHGASVSRRRHAQVPEGWRAGARAGPRQVTP